MGQPTRRVRPRHRPGRARPALRDRLDQAAHRARLGAGYPDFEAGLADRSPGTGPTRPGGGRRRPRPRPSTRRRASEPGRPRCRGHRPATDDPRPARRRPRRPRRQPRLVQGELAAAQDGRPSGCPTSARCRTTSRSTRQAGVTRGIHAEPWDKLVSVATGRIFGAWVDLRPGPDVRHRWSPSSSGPTGPSSCRAGSATPSRRWRTRTAYSYLVNDHWSAGGQGLLHLPQPGRRDRRRSPGRSRWPTPSCPTPTGTTRAWPR